MTGTGAGPGTGTTELERLAEAFDVQARYHDVEGRVRVASPEALTAVLRELGAELADGADPSGALRARLAARWRTAIEPVVVARNGRLEALRVRVATGADRDAASAEIASEDGTWSAAGALALDDAPTVAGSTVDGETFVEKTVPLTGPLAGPWPIGYHRLTLRVAGIRHEATVLSAPAMCVPYPARAWGTFLPVYAIREDDDDRGVGDLRSLRRLLDWTGGLGGGVVATLPLYAAFIGPAGPFDPSPYAPVSTLFWNELYADVASAPEFAMSREARDVAASDGFETEASALREAELIDHRSAMSLVRRLLEPMARTAAADPVRRAWLERAAEARPELDAYARFRAEVERSATSWRAWPAARRDGELRAADTDQEAFGYHRYVQALMDDQLGAMPRDPAAGRGLLLDIPVGVHPDGFDVWADREAFALGASIGAPPDSIFGGGQDWGTPPPHREHARRSGYRSLRARLRRTMDHAAVVRIDHVMGFHRLYWVPNGMPATDGVYVRYPAEELYAVLAIESHATGAAVVGEDLGTVGRDVRETMRDRGVLRTYVLELELWPARKPALPEPQAASLAALNTHDLPTFAGYVDGSDVRDRLRLGLLDASGAGQAVARRAELLRALEHALRERGLLEATCGPDGRDRDTDADGEGEGALLEGALAFLAASDARLALVNLEDLWGERRPQNRPGTGREEPNWRRRAQPSFGAFSVSADVLRILAEVDALRRRSQRAGPSAPGTADAAGAAP
jgi:4-alpha-glucanotransferase